MGIFKKSKNSWLCQVTAPEVKIFLIFCYLLAFFAVLWTSVIYGVSKHNELIAKVGLYFRCLANGVHDQQDCDQYRREFENLDVRWLQVLFSILFAFVNISNLPLIIQYKKVKYIVLSIVGRDTVDETKLSSHVGKQSKLSSHTT